VPFVTTDQAIELLREILEEEFPKRRAELLTRGAGSFGLPDVKEWLAAEWDWPEAGNGNYPRAIVHEDDPSRESERSPQDTGETATLHLVARLYFEAKGMSAGRARRTARMYADLIAYSAMRNARGKRPKDQTVLPGLFRFWPRVWRIGETESSDLFGCEVKIDLVIDTSDTFAT
jgi:hypothetical protein